MAKLRMQFDNVVHEYEYRSDETYLSAVSKTVEQFKGSGVVRFPFAYRLETLTGREVNISGWMNEKMINVPAELLSVKIFAQIIDGPYDGDNNSENICFAKHPTIEGNLCAFPKGHDGVRCNASDDSHRHLRF